MRRSCWRSSLLPPSTKRAAFQLFLIRSVKCSFGAPGDPIPEGTTLYFARQRVSQVVLDAGWDAENLHAFQELFVGGSQSSERLHLAFCVVQDLLVENRGCASCVPLK